MITSWRVLVVPQVLLEVEAGDLRSILVEVGANFLSFLKMVILHTVRSCTHWTYSSFLPTWIASQLAWLYGANPPSLCNDATPLRWWFMFLHQIWIAPLSLLHPHPYKYESLSTLSFGGNLPHYCCLESITTTFCEDLNSSRVAQIFSS